MITGIGIVTVVCNNYIIWKSRFLNPKLNIKTKKIPKPGLITYLSKVNLLQTKIS